MRPPSLLRALTSALASALIIGGLVFPTPAVVPQAVAQPAASHPQQVFLTNNQLVFVDLLAGTTTSTALASSEGTRFSVLQNAVMFYDRARHRMMLATPNGRLTEHPFITVGDEVTRVDWHVSGDEAMIAWTETSGTPSALTTVTRVAGINGDDVRLVYSDGPRDGIRAYPVAFNDDKSILYMDYQPDTIGDLTPFRQYAGLFALDLISGETKSLPGEPGCFCGAGINAGMFLRLTLAPTGFNLRVRSMVNSADTLLPPVNSYTQGGDVLIAPDGSHAVYALAQISGFGTANPSIQSVLVLVDLLNMTQYALTAPSTHVLHPLAWTEDDSAILAADQATGTTWKVTLRDGALEQVANGVYLGTIFGG